MFGADTNRLQTQCLQMPRVQTYKLKINKNSLSKSKDFSWEFNQYVCHCLCRFSTQSDQWLGEIDLFILFLETHLCSQ